ncbi:MAG: hypothetical protein AW09_001127 [Candidatus Accumulibacter phosphatis]|uniref:Uncharacterized protein n=1 Tax=Candidatus Accumulibacter phosphatis TaxID=327160 RepID=A0A080LXL5_9PROT|nr:MAG: hypothetical protein AW09_001127 [Candidatus Accumulibacter phosphatis]
MCTLLMESVCKLATAVFRHRAGTLGWLDAEVGVEQIRREDTFPPACRLHFTVQRQ